MKIIILAAGYATRLEPLTLKISKSLLAVGKKKILDRILEKIEKLGDPATSIIIISNAKFFKAFNDWLKTARYKNGISIINDGSISNETRLGAIKDLELAIRQKAIDDDILIVAGDNLFDFDLADFLKFARSKHDGVSVALHDIKDKKEARRFGVVKLDSNFKIIDFEEKPEEPKSTLISTGIYYFPKKKVHLIEKYVKMQNKFDAPGYYISWLTSTDNVYGFTFMEDWYDIGNIDSYRIADRDYLKKEK